MNREAGGVFDVAIIFPWHAVKIMHAAMTGDPRAVMYLTAIDRSVNELSKPGAECLCLLCDHVFSARDLPLAFVLCTPHTDDPEHAFTNGLCDNCMEKPQLEQQILTLYREKLFGGELRVLPPFATGSARRQ
jgi:hypothetical protein